MVFGHVPARGLPLLVNWLLERNISYQPLCMCIRTCCFLRVYYYLNSYRHYSCYNRFCIYLYPGQCLMFIHVSQFLLPNIMFTRKYCDNASPQLDIVDLHKDTVFGVKVIFETCEIILHDVTVHRRIISLSRFINFAFWRLSSFTMEVELVYVHYLNENTEHPNQLKLI